MKSNFHQRANGTETLYLLIWVLVVYCLLVLYITTVPFDFDLTLRGILAEWHDAEKIPFLRADGSHASGSDLLSNLILFIPFGFILFAIFRSQHRASKNIIFKVTLFGFLFSLFIETFQLLLNDRYTSISDLLMNTSGSLLGAYLGEKLFKPVYHLIQEFLTHLKNNPIWLIFSGLAFIYGFLVLAPFNFNLKTNHIQIFFTKWLASWGALPVFSGKGPTQLDLESFLFGALLAAIFSLALKLQKPIRKKTLFAGLALFLSYYPALSMLSLIKERNPADASFLVSGLSGLILGLFLFLRQTHNFRIRNGQFLHLKWNRRSAWVIYCLIFFVHFFYPFQLQTYKVWLNLVSSNTWLHFPRLEDWLLTAFLIEKIKIVLLALPLGYAYSRRILALNFGDRLIRMVGLGFFLGATIEFLQLAIPAQEVDLSDIVFFVLGGIFGVIFESWWRKRQLKEPFPSPLKKMLSVFQPERVLPVEK